jgi:hypothetical protein
MLRLLQLLRQTMNYRIETTWHCGATATVELPDGKTWDDIEHWFIKWDTLYLQFFGSEEVHELSLDSGGGDVDWQRPLTTEVFEAGESGPMIAND